MAALLSGGFEFDDVVGQGLEAGEAFEETVIEVAHGAEPVQALAVAVEGNEADFLAPFS